MIAFRPRLPSTNYGGGVYSCGLYVIFFNVSNVIFIEFYNKKNFPPGKWLREPDLCSWDQYDLPCLAIRDMSIGIWKGFVGLSEEHLFYNKGIDELLKSHELLEFFFSIHGGVCNAGRLPLKYKDHAKNFWWVVWKRLMAMI